MQQPLNLYLAAVYTNSYMPGGNRYPKLNPAERDVMKRVKHHNILESYHYVHGNRFVTNMRDNEAKVFLDSGAFSAWMGGVTIDINNYCRYIQDNIDIIRHDGNDVMASVLDAIGDAEGTLHNQKEMEKLGVRPLPCFHKGEDPKFLEYYLKNYDYITIGGMVGSSAKALEEWLDPIFANYIEDSSGNPRCKVHGFGLTSIPLMERYPWFSVDSSSWIQAASFGSVVIPNYGPLPVSEDSPSLCNKGRHLLNMTPAEMYELECMLFKGGFGKKRLGTIYESRAVCNMYGYMEIQDAVNRMKPNHTPNYNIGLFDV